MGPQTRLQKSKVGQEGGAHAALESAGLWIWRYETSASARHICDGRQMGAGTVPPRPHVGEVVKRARRRRAR